MFCNKCNICNASFTKLNVIYLRVETPVVLLFFPTRYENSLASCHVIMKISIYFLILSNSIILQSAFLRGIAYTRQTLWYFIINSANKSYDLAINHFKETKLHKNESAFNVLYIAYWICIFTKEYIRMIDSKLIHFQSSAEFVGMTRISVSSSVQSMFN